MAEHEIPTWLAEADSDVAADAVAKVAKYVFKAHPGQKPVIESKARYKVVCAGRRFGKTKLAARMMVEKALDKPGSLSWWVAPEYKNIKRGYAEVVAQIPPQFLAKPAPPATSQNLVIEFKNGSVLEFYSGKNPDALAGAKVDLVIIDEAALVPHGGDVWNGLIRPTLLDSGGEALFISTPRGKNWFWQLYNQGLSQSIKFKDWECWHFTSLDNPTIPVYIRDPEEREKVRREELEAYRQTMPEMLFKQEMLAEFLSSAASIFNLEHPEAVVSTVEDPVGTVYMGVDLAKKQDFTVITASRAGDRLPVYHQRFNQIKWTEQRQLIRDAVDAIMDMGAEEVVVGVDATGVGDAIADDLEAEGLNVERILFSNQWKERAVGVLSKDLQNGDAHILADQQEEFEHYEYELTPAGHYKFESSVGHDDEVAAKLIEHWLLHTSGLGDVKVVNRHPEAALVDTGVPVVRTAGAPDDRQSIMDNPNAWDGSGFGRTFAGTYR